MGIGINLAKLIVPIIADTEEFEQGISKAKGLTQGFTGNIQKAGKTIVTGLGVGLAAGAAGATALGGAMVKLASDAAPLVNVRNAFDGIAESAGSSGEAMLEAFDKATGSMVDHESAMMSYNKAAQLVSTEFAGQLPDAMGYVGKVAAATGEDMGFMLDSLVTGVGRLSPMILDNLGIQVTLAEAVERASEMYGVEADALSKTQQQAGMMDVVLQKLAKNTAAMPDITKSAAGQMESLKNQVKNTKDAVGMALVPMLGKLLGAFKPLIEKALPVIVDLFQNKIGPAMEKAADWINVLIELGGEWFGSMEDGLGPIEALGQALWSLGFESIGETVRGFQQKLDEVINSVMNVIAVVQPYLTMVWEWIENNIQLKDVLIALGVIIASVVVPALVSMAVSALPVIAAVLAVIGIVALVRKVWEDHGDAIKAKAEEVWGWIRDNVPPAIEKVKLVVETVLNAIKGFWERHKEAVMAVVQSFWNLIQSIFERVTKIIKGIMDFFRSDSESSWSKWKVVIESIVDAAWTIIETLFDLALKQIKTLFDIFAALFRGDWEALWEGVKTLFENIWNALKTVMETIWGAITAAFGAFKDNLEPIATAISGFFQGISTAIGWISDAIGTAVGWISSIIAWLEKLLLVDIPDWLKTSSPPAMAQGFYYIADAIEQVNAALSKDMSLNINSQYSGLMGTLAKQQAMGTTDNSRTVNLTVNNPIARPTGEGDYYTALALID